MNRVKNIFHVSIMSALLIIGCLSNNTKMIGQEHLKLTKGSRIMMFQAIGGTVSPEIKTFRLDAELPGIEFIDPPTADIQVNGLDMYIRDISGTRSIDRYFVIISRTKVERQYNPVSVHKGYKNMPYRVQESGGGYRYEYRSEPVFKKTYKNVCTRTEYRLLLYDRDGRSEGKLNIENPHQDKCPENTDKDIHSDDVEYLKSWLKSKFTSQ